MAGTANSSLYADRFKAAIQQFAAETGADARAITQLVNRPISTVYKWLSGQQAPRRADLKQLCAAFNWDYDAMFDADLLVERVIHQSFLSFDALNRRYAELRSQEVCEALELLSVAGTRAHSFFINNGARCTLTVDSSYQVHLQLEDPDLDRHGFVLLGHAQRGLLISMCDLHRHRLGDWKSLTLLGLNELLITVNRYKKNKYGQSTFSRETTAGSGTPA